MQPTEIVGSNCPRAGFDWSGQRSHLKKWTLKRAALAWRESNEPALIYLRLGLARPASSSGLFSDI